MFNVVAGYDPADPYSEAGRGRQADDYTAFLDPNGLEGSRIGVLRALVDTEDADTAVMRVFQSALADLALLGAEVVDPFEVPGWDELLDAANFCARFRYDMRQYLLSLGDGAPITDVREAFEAGQYSEYVGQRLDGLTQAPADVHPADADPPCRDYADHPGRQAFLAAVVAAMDEAGLEAVVYPTWTTPPAHLDRAIEEYAGDNSQVVAPATGMPAVSVPMGFTYGSLPAGLQILARPYDEGTLFRLAYAYEQGTLHRRPPEGFGPLPPPE